MKLPSQKYLDLTREPDQEWDMNQLAAELGVPVQHLCDIIVDNWGRRKGQLVGSKWRTDLEYRERWYGEVVLDSRYKRGNTRQILLSEMLDFQSSFYRQFDGRKDSHMSTFLHTKNWHDNAQKTGSVAMQNINDTMHFMPIFWIEMDRESHEKAARDAFTVIQSLPSSEYEVFWSGNRSPHIAINGALFGFPANQGKHLAGNGRHAFNLASALCRDVRHNNGVFDTQEMTREEILKELAKLGITDPTKQSILQNYDPAIYGPNKLIRAPYSIHEKTMRKKGVYLPEELEAGLQPEKFRESYKSFNPNTPPIFLYLSFMSQWVRHSPLHKPHAPGVINVAANDIRSFYLELFPEIAGRSENGEGWIGGLRNPFYPDGRASVSVNLRTGRFYDFGNPQEYDLVFSQVYALVNGINPEQANHRLSYLNTL